MAPPTSALRLTGLRKRYKRRGPWALDGLSCTFPTGSICGLVGPNGAGKTTLFSVICGFLPPDEGQVDILGGGPFDPWRLKGRLGVLPQDAAIGGRLTCRDFLSYLGGLQGLSGEPLRRAVDLALADVQLTDRAGHKAGSLSHGMRRRLSVAAALLGEPELVLLDEPMAGLDPAQGRSLRQALKRRHGHATLVVSSHDLAELERLCDHVVLMDAGRLVRQGTVEEVTGRGTRTRWGLGPGDAPLDALAALLEGHALSIEDGALLHEAPRGADLDAASIVIAGALAEAGIPIRTVQRGTSLEERFLAETTPVDEGE
jgi:ABC-2 type transport system ATP-binding protein